MVSLTAHAGNQAEAPNRPASASIPQPTFTCRAGLRPIRNSPQNEMWIISPRTGKEISFSDGWFNELPAGMVAKVAKHCAGGNHLIPFTREELHAAFAINDRLTKLAAPLKRLFSTTYIKGASRNRFGRRGYSRSWGGGR